MRYIRCAWWWRTQTEGERHDGALLGRLCRLVELGCGRSWVKKSTLPPNKPSLRPHGHPPARRCHARCRQRLARLRRMSSLAWSLPLRVRLTQAFRGSVSVRFLKGIFPRLPAKRAIVYSAQERKKKEMSPDDNEVPLYHFRRNGNQRRSQEPNRTTNSAAVSLRKGNCVLRELLKCEKKTQIKEFKERERKKKSQDKGKSTL